MRVYRKQMLATLFLAIIVYVARYYSWPFGSLHGPSDLMNIPVEYFTNFHTHLSEKLYPGGLTQADRIDSIKYLFNQIVNVCRKINLPVFIEGGMLIAIDRRVEFSLWDVS